MEKDNEVKGIGNHYTAFFGEYSPRDVHRWNLDPKPVAWKSPYSMYRGNPIWYADPLLDYSRVGAMWRNFVHGGNGITKTFLRDGEKGKTDWGYTTTNKEGDAVFHFGKSNGLSFGDRLNRWGARTGDKLNAANRWLGDLFGRDNSGLPPKNYNPNGGGIIFTSSSGQNQERRLVGNPDGKSESIDDIGIITGNHGGSGGLGNLKPMEPLLNIFISLDLFHQTSDRLKLTHDWGKLNINDTNINVLDPKSKYGFKTISVDKSEVGTRYITPPNNVTYTVDTEQ